MKTDRELMEILAAPQMPSEQLTPLLLELIREVLRLREFERQHQPKIVVTKGGDALNAPKPTDLELAQGLLHRASQSIKGQAAEHLDSAIWQAADGCLHLRRAAATAGLQDVPGLDRITGFGAILGPEPSAR